MERYFITLMITQIRGVNHLSEHIPMDIYAYSRVSEPEDTEYLRELRHGYYACVSYVDAQIGMILNTLKELDLEKNTIVILLGDHGWNLGEHNFIGLT